MGRDSSWGEYRKFIVDIWLALRQACAQDSGTPETDVIGAGVTGQGVTIERWLPEMQCRHEYQIRHKGNGQWRKEAFKPDAFVRLAGNGRYFHYFIEVDLGHTSSRQFLGKLLTHQRYLESGLFEQIYAGREFHTLVVTTGQRRLRNLSALVEKHNSRLFWFTTFADIAQNGALGAIWHQREGEPTTGLV